MFWRPLAVLLSVAPAAAVTLLFAGYIRAAHDLSRTVEIVLVSPVFLASWYVAMAWLVGSESLKHAMSRAGASIRLLGVAGIVLAGLWVLGFFRSDVDLAGFSCPRCDLVNVIRIIDGDTLDTNIGRVRLYGIDAPEIGERCAQEATRELRRLAGNRVRVEDGPRRFDPFGRRLAYVYREDGQSIDARLVSGGYARAWTADGQHKQRLLELEAMAEGAGTGCLW